MLISLARLLVIFVPRNRFFCLLLMLSRILTLPVQRAKLSLIKEWPLSRDVNAMVLRIILDYVTHSGGRFELVVSGAEKAKKEIKEAYASKNRLILCSAHFPLNRVIHRLMHDWGIATVTVRDQWPDKTPSGWIWGVGGSADTIENSENILMDAWEKVYKNNALIILLDNVKKTKNSLPFCETGGYRFYIAPNLFRFAALTETPVIFFSSSLSNGKIHIKIKKRAMNYPKSRTDIDAYVNGFMEFLKQEMISNQGFPNLMSLHE